jgi:hypothetical protein
MYEISHGILVMISYLGKFQFSSLDHCFVVINCTRFTHAINGDKFLIIG